MITTTMTDFGQNLYYYCPCPSSVWRRQHSTPLQYSCLENPMDGGAWKVEVHGVTEGQTQLSDFTFTFHFHALEKEMATHSSVLACRIPGMGEPGGLPSLGSHRVGHDQGDLAAAAASTRSNYCNLNWWKKRKIIGSEEEIGSKPRTDQP